MTPTVALEDALKFEWLYTPILDHQAAHGETGQSFGGGRETIPFLEQSAI
jgi:hypothetical protein